MSANSASSDSTPATDAQEATMGSRIPSAVADSPVTDWMTPAPNAFSPDTTVEQARAAMVGFRHAPVVSHGRLVGYLHACALTWQEGSRPLGSLPLARGLVLPADTPLRAALHRLRSSRHDVLFVGPTGAEGPVLEGVFTEHDGIGAVLAGLPDALLSKPARLVASRPVDVVAPETPLGDVRAQLATRWFRHLPVVVDGRAVGMISWRDVIAGNDAVRCDNVMTSPVWTVGAEATIRQVAQRMLEGRVGAFPVLEDGEVAGIITRTDLFAALLDVAEVA